jgi:hypothetical protein
MVAGAIERWPIETIKEKENGHKPSFVQKEKKEEEAHIVGSQINVQEEILVEFLINCSKEDKQRITAELEPATWERTDGVDLVDLYEELEALGDRIITQSRLIQQVRL